MADKLFVMPAEGRVIPDPATGRDLPAHGTAVTPSRIWRLHLRDRDVVETTAEEIAKAEAAMIAAPEPETATKKKGG